jgi:hypothetical protein
MINVGLGQLWVGWDNAMTVNNGILLPGTGGSLCVLVDEDGELPTYDAYILNNGVINSAVSIWEMIRK